MKYRLRFSGTNLYTIHESDVVESNGSEEEIRSLVKKVQYDEIVTIFTKVEDTFYQYSTASKNSSNLLNMVCFGASSMDYAKYDDTSLYHSVGEVLRVAERLQKGQELKEIKLVDYAENSGEEIELPFEFGQEIKGGVCVGCVVKQVGDKHTATSIVSSKEKWDEFVSLLGVEENKFELVTELLMER